MTSSRTQRKISRISEDEVLADLRTYGKPIMINGVERSMYAIGELARALNRRPGTIRKWEDLGILPIATFIKGTGTITGRRRLYTADQIVGIVRIADEEGILHNEGTINIRATEFAARVQTLFENLRLTAAA